MRRLKLFLMLCMVAIAASASKTVCLAPNIWNVGGERYALCLLSNPQVWINFTDTDGDGVYTATFVDSSCTQMIICRMNGSNAENRWNNDGETGDDRPMWNQTQNIPVPTINDLTYIITGWENDNGKSGYNMAAYIYNEDADLFFSRGNDWGTQAVAAPVGLPWKLEFSDGKYTLKMYDINTQNSADVGLGYAGAFTDSGDPLAFTPQGDATNGYTLKNGDNHINCPSTAGIMNFNTTPSNWKFLSQAQYNAVLAARATAQEAQIATLKSITIPDGSNLDEVVNDANNWTVSATVNDGAPTSGNWTATMHEGRGGNNNWGDYGSEMFQCGTAHYTRTITGLKQGIYKVSVRAMKRVGINENCYAMGQAGLSASDSYMDANGYIIPIKAWSDDCAGNANPDSPADFVNIVNNGGYTTEGFVYVGSDGNLTMNVTSEAFWWGCWFLFNGISYTYYNNEVSTEDAIAIIATAYGFKDAKMNSSVKTALTNALNTFDEDRTVGNYNALNTAISNANVSIANYAEIVTILAAAEGYDSYGQESYAANETIAAIQAGYDDGSIEAVTNEQKDAAKVALITACKAQVQPLDNSDMTPYIVNPGIDGNSTGWTCEKMGNTDNTGGPMKPSNDALEYWGFSATDDQAAYRNFDYYQIITNLPNGAYTVGASLLNSTNNEDGAEWDNGGNAGVYGETTDDEVIALVYTNSDTFAPYTTEEILVIDGTLRIGVKNINTLTGRWFAADNFKLTYVRQLTDEEKTAIAEEYYYEALNNAKTTAATHERISRHWLDELNGTISTYDIGNVEDTESAYLEATAALNAANEMAEKSIASYAIIASGTVRTDVLDGWTCTNEQTFHINTWSEEGNSDGSGMTTPFIENWVASGSFLGEGTFSYTLEGLEPGEVYYAQGLIRSYNEANATAPNGPDFFVNGTTARLSEVGTTFTYNGKSGIFATLGVAALVGADGKITIGARIANDANYNWVAFKNVSIMSMVDALNAAIAKVTALEGTVPTGVFNIANEVVTANTGEYMPTTVAGFEEAIAAIEAAAETAALAVAPFSANADYLDWVTKTKTNLAEYNDAVTLLQNVIDNNTDNLNACTTADEVIAYNESLWTEIGNAINTIELTNDDKLDLTFLLVNPDVSEGFADSQKNIEGWYTEQIGGNSQVKNITGESVADDGTHWIYEYWSETAAANNKFTLYQKVNLPEGTYDISCYAFASANGVEGATNSQVYFYANDTQGSRVTTTKLTIQDVAFVNDAQQEVKMGLKALEGNEFRWMGIAKMKLYKVAEKNYVIDESTPWTSIDAAGDVTLNRTIKVGVNTLVLPFSMTQAEVEENFGVGSKVYVIESYDATVNNISFATHNGISANQPCLLKATEAGTSYELESRTIVAGEPVMNAIDESVSMTGSYEASITVPTEGNNYIISNKEGEPKIYFVDSAVTLKNTRAYITLPQTGARILRMSFDDEEITGIATLESGKLKMDTGDLYDLSGRKVNNPTKKGIYLMNGKKVIK